MGASTLPLPSAIPTRPQLHREDDPGTQGASRVWVGSWTLEDVDSPGVCAIRCEYEGNVAVAVHNFYLWPCDTVLDLPEDEWRELFEVLADGAYEPAGHTAHRIHLEGYGYRWFRRGRLGP